MTDPVEYANIPREPDEIKNAIKLRREAISLMLQEIAMLTDVLRAKLGPVQMLLWMNEQSEITRQQDEVARQRRADQAYKAQHPGEGEI